MKENTETSRKEGGSKNVKKRGSRVKEARNPSFRDSKARAKRTSNSHRVTCLMQEGNFKHGRVSWGQSETLSVHHIQKVDREIDKTDRARHRILHKEQPEALKNGGTSASRRAGSGGASCT